MIIFYILLAALCIGIPVIIMLKTNQSKSAAAGAGALHAETAISAIVRRCAPKSQKITI